MILLPGKCLATYCTQHIWNITSGFFFRVKLKLKLIEQLMCITLLQDKRFMPQQTAISMA